MNKKNIVKGVVGLGASICVSTVVGLCIKHNIPIAELKGLEKGMVAVGLFVIGSMVGTAASKHVGEFVDDVATAMDEVKKASENAAAAAQAA